MTAPLVYLDDYRPLVPGVADLWLNAVFHIWRGLAVLSVIPLVMFIRRGR